MVKKLKDAMNNRGISIYRLAKLSGIKYELLRRVFVGERKLLAEELITILKVTGISFEEVI